jgi:hypothetical protein
MLYVKAILLVIGVVELGMLDLPIMYSLGPLLWMAATLVFLAGIMITQGLHSVMATIKTIVVMTIAWTCGAALIAIWQASPGQYLSFLYESGPQKAVRFSSVMTFAVLQISLIKPVEIGQARLLPTSVKHFILMFRSFVSRYTSILSDALDYLHSVGWPATGKLVLSLVRPSTPYPTHQSHQMTLSRRWSVTGAIVITMLIYFFEKALSVELPEVDAAWMDLTTMSGE